MLIARDWRLFGGEAEAQLWVKQVAENDEFLLRILNQLRSTIRSRSVSDRVARTRPYIDGKYLLTFFEASDIRARCNRVLAEPPEWLSEIDRETLEIVLDTVMENGMVRDAFSRTPIDPKQTNIDESESEEIV
jgi:hypothetical protein